MLREQDWVLPKRKFDIVSGLAADSKKLLAVAGIARKELELRSGEPVANPENYIEEPEKIKRIKQKKREFLT